MTAERDELVARLRRAGCVWAEDEADLLVDATPDPDTRERLVARRESGEPLEIVLGWVAFRGRRIVVAPGVFVPRQRSALLVDVALEHLPSGGLLADICCGAGALAASVRAERPDARIVASDIDPRAVEVARRNLPGILVVQGDLMAGLPQGIRGGVDVLLANVPYVPSSAIVSLPPEAREHEPLATLDGGPDGLDVLRRLLGEAAEWLGLGGALISEIAPSQLEAATGAIREARLHPSSGRSPDRETVAVIATRTA